jgi:hypothetical protein
MAVRIHDNPSKCLKTNEPTGLFLLVIFAEIFIRIFLSNEVLHFLSVAFLKTQSAASQKNARYFAENIASIPKTNKATKQIKRHHFDMEWG